MEKGKTMNYLVVLTAALAFIVTETRGASPQVATFAKVTVVTLGSSCSDNATCTNSVGNSYCSSLPSNGTRSCVCSQGYFASGDKIRCVLPSVMIGDKCEESQQCFPFGKFASTNSSAVLCLPGGKICSCPPKYIQSSDLKDCLKIVNTLDAEECLEDGQCQLGWPGPMSICTKVVKNILIPSMVTKVCRCNATSVDSPDRGTCSPKARYVGDRCYFQAQCTSTLKYSRCLDGKCQCMPGYVRDSGKENEKCIAKASG